MTLEFDELSPLHQGLISNGCGPKVGIKPPQCAFGEPCNFHDFDYWVGGDLHERLKADRDFLRRMLKEVDKLPLLKRLYARPWAHLYYRLVRWFGGLFWNFGAKRGLWDLIKLETVAGLSRGWVGVKPDLLRELLESMDEVAKEARRYSAAIEVSERMGDD